MGELLSTKQVADRLGKNVRTIHRWVEAGKLVPFMKVAGDTGTYLFAPADVARLEHEPVTSNGAT